jgi:hypothetical protein
MRWNEYWTLRIVSADLLWKIGECTHANTSFEGTPQCTMLRSEILKAVNGIYSSAASLLSMNIRKLSSTPRTFGVWSTELGYMLSTIWPVYCASKARGVAENQCARLKDMLWQVGETGRIPIALSLV